MLRFLALASRPNIVKRSLVVALIVGTVLNLINQGDLLMYSGAINLLKILLTYMVPYCVATYGAVSALLDQQNSPATDTQNHRDSTAD